MKLCKYPSLIYTSMSDPQYIVHMSSVLADNSNLRTVCVCVCVEHKLAIQIQQYTKVSIQSTVITTVHKPI